MSGDVFLHCRRRRPRKGFRSGLRRRYVRRANVGHVPCPFAVERVEEQKRSGRDEKRCGGWRLVGDTLRLTNMEVETTRFVEETS